MTSSDDLRRWAWNLRLWAESNPYPKAVAQMISLAHEFELAAGRQKRRPDKPPRLHELPRRVVLPNARDNPSASLGNERIQPGRVALGPGAEG